MPRGRDKKEKRNFRAEIISAPEAAALIKVSERTFDRLVNSGKIPKDDYGRYVLGEVLDGYLESLFDDKGLKEAQTSLIRAKAKREEKALAEEEGELHRASVVQKIWAERNLNIKSKLLAIPTKIAPELVGQDLQVMQMKLKREINETLKELAEYDAGQITSAALLTD